MDILTQAHEFADQLQTSNFAEQRDILQDILRRIDLGSEDVTLALNLNNMRVQLSDGDTGQSVDGLQDTLIQLTIPLKLKRRGAETKLVLGGDTPAFNLDQKMIKMIARAHIWFQQLSTGVVTSVHQIAEQEKCDASEVSRVMPLAFLAPDLVTAILEGRQPVDLTADRLKRLSGGLPICWRQQKTALEFSD